MATDEIKYYDDLGHEITKERALEIAKEKKNKLITKKMTDKDKLLFDKTTINK